MIDIVTCVMGDDGPYAWVTSLKGGVKTIKKVRIMVDEGGKPGII